MILFETLFALSYGFIYRQQWPRGLEVAAMLVLVALVLVGTRLPSGNVWDAVLDPGLWLVVQLWGLRQVWICYKNRSCLRNIHVA